MSDDERPLPEGLQGVLVARLRAIPDGQVTKTAKQAGIDLVQLMRLRRGKNTDVRLSMLEKLARGLGETVGGMLGTTDTPVVASEPPPLNRRAVKRAVKTLRGVADVAEWLAALLPEDER